MTEKRFVLAVGSTGVFEEMVRASGELGNLSGDGEKAVSLFSFLLQDIFYALYEESPILLPITEVSTGARLNHLLLDQLMKSREFRRVRVFTRGNRNGAAMVTIYYGTLVLEGLSHEITDTVNEIYCSEEELFEALLRKMAAEKVVRVAETENRPDAASLYRFEVEQWEAFAFDKRKHLRSLAARLNLLWNTSGRKNTAMTGEAAGGEKEGRFETGADGQGDNRGVWTRGDLSSHLKLVETYRSSPKLRRMAQKIGRLKEVREQRRGREALADAAEVRGITFGDDLALVVPEEWADYLDPGRRTGFRKRYADEVLCQFDLQAGRRKGKGSIILCLDNSGSMQGPKEETAKAIAIALMELAGAQGRDFVAIMFGGPDDEMKIFEVPRGRCSFEQLVEIGEHFLCSAGTDFEKPLAEAVRYLEKGRYPGGDIVFITDGVCSVSPEFLERYKMLKRTGRFRTVTVLVNYGQVSTAPVEAFSDEVLFSKDLKGLDIAGELFSMVGKG